MAKGSSSGGSSETLCLQGAENDLNRVLSTSSTCASVCTDGNPCIYFNTTNDRLYKCSFGCSVLSQCALEEVPFVMKNVPELTTLELSHNNLQEIPPQTLPLSLEFLNLKYTGLSEIPQDISKMKNLQTLGLSANFITEIPEKSLPSSLTKLSLSYTGLTTFETFDSIVNSPELTTLDLSVNSFESIPEFIYDLKKLSYLSVAGNPSLKNVRFTKDQVTALNRLDNLEIDEESLDTFCEEDSKVDLQDFKVCLHEPDQPDSATVGPIKNDTNRSTSKKTSAWLIVTNIIAGLLLVLLLSIAWYKRRRRLQFMAQNSMNPSEMSDTSGSSTSIWDEELLLKNRIDTKELQKIRPLATGAYGEVWLGTYSEYDQQVAIKQLKESTADREEIQQFVSEIKLMTKLEYPKVVRFMGVAWTKKTDLMLVTEYMDNSDLRSYLEKTPAQEWDERMYRIAVNIAEALVYLNSLDPKVIHRDLKSRNILLDAEYNAKLSDFGISRYRDEDHTMTACVGTVRWIAPEVLEGKRYNELVDVYSLGVILSEIDTHQLPYHNLKSEDDRELSESATELVMSGTGASLLGFTKNCPSKITTLARRCVSHDPEKRPPAVVVAFELRNLLHESMGISSSLTTMPTSIDTIVEFPRTSQSKVEGGQKDSISST